MVSEPYTNPLLLFFLFSIKNESFSNNSPQSGTSPRGYLPPPSTPVSSLPGLLSPLFPSPCHFRITEGRTNPFPSQTTKLFAVNHSRSDL